MEEQKLKSTSTNSFSEKIRNGILDIFGDKITEKLHPKEKDNQVDRLDNVDSRKGPTVSNCERISDFKMAGNYVTRQSPVRLHKEFPSNDRSRRVTVESLFHFRSLFNTNNLNNFYYHNMTQLVASFIDSEIKKFCRQMNKKGQKGKKRKKGQILAMKLMDVLLNFLGDSVEFLVEAILSANLLGSKCKRFSCLFFKEFFKRKRMIDHKGNKDTCIKLILLYKLWASIEEMKQRSLYVIALAKKHFRAPSSLKLNISNGKYDGVLSFPNILTFTKSLPRCKVPIRKSIHTCLGYLKKKNVSLINSQIVIDNRRVEETGEAVSCDAVIDIKININGSNLNNNDNRGLNDSNIHNSCCDLQTLDWIPDPADKESFESLYAVDDGSDDSCSNINLSAESISLLKVPIRPNFADSKQNALISSTLLNNDNLQNVDKTQNSQYNSENNVDHIESPLQTHTKCDINAFSTSRNINLSVQKNTQSHEYYKIIKPISKTAQTESFQTTVKTQKLNKILQDKESFVSTTGSKVKYISLNKYKKQINYIEKIIKYVQDLKENEVLSIFDNTILHKNKLNYNNQENTNVKIYKTPLSLLKKKEKSRNQRKTINKRSLHKPNMFVSDLLQKNSIIIKSSLPAQFYVPIFEVKPPINRTIKHEYIKNVAKCLMLEPQHTISIPDQTLTALKQNYLCQWNHVLTLWHYQILNRNQQYFLNPLKMSINPYYYQRKESKEINARTVERCVCFFCNNNYNILVQHYEYCIHKLYNLMDISVKNSSQSKKKQNPNQKQTKQILTNSTHQIPPIQSNQQYTVMNGNNINPIVIPQLSSVINLNGIINPPCLFCDWSNSAPNQYSYYIKTYNELNHFFLKKFIDPQTEEYRLNFPGTQFPLSNSLYIPDRNELIDNERFPLPNNLFNPQNEQQRLMMAFKEDRFLLLNNFNHSQGINLVRNEHGSYSFPNSFINTQSEEQRLNMAIHGCYSVPYNFINAQKDEQRACIEHVSYSLPNNLFQWN